MHHCTTRMFSFSQERPWQGMAQGMARQPRRKHRVQPQSSASWPAANSLLARPASALSKRRGLPAWPDALCKSYRHRSLHPAHCSRRCLSALERLRLPLWTSGTEQRLIRSNLLSMADLFFQFSRSKLHTLGTLDSLLFAYASLLLPDPSAP